MDYIGIDTSNYTTSAAVFDGKSVRQKKIMLTVRQGERGLRQSEALFQHTVNLPKVLDALEFESPSAVGVSVRPRNADGSYMPCFLAGEGVAAAMAKAAPCPLYKTSHQVGHILAALFSAGQLDLINKRFLAFHLSGGTTELLLVQSDSERIVKSDIISQSLDLKAGQAIDRAGVMLGMNFPCGKELDELSMRCNDEIKIKPTMKGLNCSLSGVENKTKQLIDSGADREYIAKFVLTCVSQTVKQMLTKAIEEYGEMPVIFSGGVSSNSLLRKTVSQLENVYFAERDFSLDNAAGCAIFAYLKSQE